MKKRYRIYITFRIEERSTRTMLPWWSFSDIYAFVCVPLLYDGQPDIRSIDFGDFNYIEPLKA